MPDEPRTSAAELASALGYSSARRLRGMIKARLAQLSQLGEVLVLPRSYSAPRGVVRTGVEFWLTERQAEYIRLRGRGGARRALALLAAQ